MILVDSSVWIDYFSGNDSTEADFLDRTLGNRAVAIGDLILTEVLQGFRHEKDYKTAKSLLLELTVFELLGKKIAIKSADNFRKLRKKGITIRKTADVIIASYCIEQNLPLLFSDKDFQPFVEHLGLRNAAYI
ncbi:PIN domain nuclease [Gilvimarinus japonicus]